MVQVNHIQIQMPMEIQEDLKISRACVSWECQWIALTPAPRHKKAGRNRSVIGDVRCGLAGWRRGVRVVRARSGMRKSCESRLRPLDLGFLYPKQRQTWLLLGDKRKDLCLVHTAFIPYRSRQRQTRPSVYSVHLLHPQHRHHIDKSINMQFIHNIQEKAQGFMAPSGQTEAGHAETTTATTGHTATDGTTTSKFSSQMNQLR